MQGRVAIALLRSRSVRTALLCIAVLALCLPVIVTGGIVGMLAQEEQERCSGAMAVEPPAGGRAPAEGMYAQPLQLVPGRWYEVGATEYGGPNDSAGDYGSIPSPGESYLPSHPQSFAELSLLSSNPANGGSFDFADANALGNLPYLSLLRVEHGGREALLAKRDTGYGQGAQFIANGQPYRIDVWWQAAAQLGISKSAVRISLAPASGSAASLEALPSSSEAAPGRVAADACPGSSVNGLGLPLTPGTQTRILPGGLAAAGEEAPRAVKLMVAAGNRLYGTAYLYGGAHGTSLDIREPAYDCSSAVSYVLHGGGELDSSALDSTALQSYGVPGPGRYVSIYSNPGHTFMYVAGLRFDTVEAPAYDSGPNSGKSGPRWRVSASVPGWASWVVRHPPGL